MDTTLQDTALGTGGRALLAGPVGDGPWPGVVMLHEIWGIDDVLRRQAARLAAARYLVQAPDLFGEGNRLGCIVRTIRALGTGSGRPFDLAEAAQRQLQQDPDCTGKVGVIGFCMGGGFALVLGAHGFDASSVNYGSVPADLDTALRGSCPLVGSYGGRDRQLAKQVPRLEETLVRLGIPHDVQVYPTAGHSFLNDEENGPRLLRPLLRVAGVGPEPVAAADAWQRIEAFFATHLAPAAGAR